jgi:hypothetical protein
MKIVVSRTTPAASIWTSMVSPISPFKRSNPPSAREPGAPRTRTDASAGVTRTSTVFRAMGAVASALGGSGRDEARETDEAGEVPRVTA